jgi:hypothetical protein
VATAGQVCYNLTGAALPPFTGCPAPGAIKRLVRQIVPAALCP